MSAKPPQQSPANTSTRTERHDAVTVPDRVLISLVYPDGRVIQQAVA